MCHPEVPAGLAAPEVERADVIVPLRGGETMPALIATPDHHSGPGVLVVADVYGRSPFYENLAARLATAGFNALLPDFFFREGPLPERTLEAAAARRSALDERRCLEDLHSAVSWLRTRTGTESGARTGTVGCCMGGTFVLDLASKRQDLATVCYYGFPAVRRSGETNLPAPLDVLDNITGPILGFWGDQDERVGMENVRTLAVGLAERGVPFDHTIYPGLGHGFLAASNLEEGGPGYDQACDSWTKTIAFFRQHL